MDCPVCNQAMITLELSGVETDCCVSCRGVWLDAGELEILVLDRAKAQTLLASFQEARGLRERPRACPICDKRMAKVRAGTGGPVIDRCPRGHGLWFDQGELQAVLDRADLGEGHPIKALLQEMFGQRQTNPD